MLNILLQTKFYAPRWETDFVARPRLRARLNAALQRQLTLVSAPAGFGKTMLVSEWLATLPAGNAQFCWLSLDEGDNDPVRFFAHFIAALQTVAPNLGPLAELIQQAAQLPPVEALMSPLINELTASAHPIIFVLDDYHLIETPAIHQALSFLLEHLPLSLHLMIITRSDPPWRLARLRTRNQLCEVRAADLRFQPDEVADFLQRVMQLPLAAAEVAALEQRTEGWIAGLQMAALSMQGLGDIAGFVRAFTGSNRYILDYLTDEVIDRQPPALRDFLLRTSLLERLCASLCDALLVDNAQSSTSNSDSQTLLERLEAANLFLVPLDNQRHWFRYHHLFAEMLQHRLRRTQPQLIPQLYRRASGWCEQNGLWDEAVGYALAAKDFDGAARLLAKIGLEMVVETQIGKLLHWIEQVPLETRLAYPRLMIAFAWALLWAGQLEMVEPLLQQTESGVDNPPYVAAHAAAMRSFVANLHGEMAAASHWSQEALRLSVLSHGDADATMRMVRGIALITLGDSHRLAGNLAPAHAAYEESIPLNLQMGNLFGALGSTWSLGDIAQARGQLPRAVERLRGGLAMVQRFQAEQGRGDALVTHFIHLQLGTVLYQMNQLAEAEQHVERAAQLYELSGVMDLHPTDSMLARLKIAQGDSEAAQQLLPKAGALSQAAGPQLAHARGEAERIRLALLFAATEPDAARLQRQLTEWMAARQLRYDDEVPYTCEFEYAMLARVLLALNALDEAQNLLQRLIALAESGERHGDLIEYLILVALTLRAEGQTALALTPLQRALTLAQAGGYLRIFVDEGQPMRALLVELRPRLAPALLGYVDRVLDAFPASTPVTADPPQTTSKALSATLLEPLTTREQEVLRHLAEGLSNQEIAERLIISPGTAKRHVANIFEKLGVVNRTQAIHRARQERLL